MTVRPHLHPARVLLAGAVLALVTGFPSTPAGATSIATAQTSGASGEPTPAAAAVEKVTPTPDGGWRFPLKRLGFGPTTRLTGGFARLDFFVGVPDGMTAVSLNANLFISSDVTDGFMEVRDGQDRVVATIDVGKDLAQRSPPGRPISIPLTGAAVRDHGISLSLIARLRSVDDLCSTAFVGAHIDLNDAAIIYSGDGSAPSTVGEFFPPVLTSVNLVVPNSPSVTQIDAAVKVAAGILSRYRGTIVDFAVTTGTAAGGPSAHATPFDRTVIIGSGASGLQIAGGSRPTLTIGGNGDSLSKQAELVASTLAPLSIAPQVAVADIHTTDDIGRRRVSFDELGLRGLQQTGVGQMSLPLTITQFDLGGAVEHLHVQLSGAHTPAVGGIQATLEILVNDVVVKTANLGQSGSFSEGFDIDGALLRRDNRLIVRVDHTPAGGECRLGVHPFVIQIDPGSYIDGTPGQSLPAGFTRFPQILRPNFVMAVDPDPLAVESAVQLLGLLQPLAGRPLHPKVVSVDDARASSSPAIIVGGAATVHGLDLPLQPDAFRVVGPGGKEVLRLDVNRDFAALEGFESNGRDVLALTYRGDSGLMKNLVTGIASDSLGWFGLTGDTYLQPAGDTPVGLRLRGAELTAKAITPPGDGFWDKYRTYVIGVLAVVALAFLLWAYPRVVRPAPEGVS